MQFLPKACMRRVFSHNVFSGVAMRTRLHFSAFLVTIIYFMAALIGTNNTATPQSTHENFSSMVRSLNRSSVLPPTTEQYSSLAPGMHAQQEQAPPAPAIAVESDLVVLNVLVTDEDGIVLSALKKDNFRILDNGKPQVVTTFAPTEDPITIVLLLEYSGLAYDYFAYKAAYWGAAFLDHLDGQDWVALVTYDIKPAIQVDFTRNKPQVRDTLGSLGYPGFHEANMFDAIVDMLDKLERVKGKKSILLITTGADTMSRTTLEETVKRLKQSDVKVFCVGVAESEYQQAQTAAGTSMIGYLQSKNQLQSFANLTGGLAWFPRFEGEMLDIFKSVAAFLRNEYVIGFSPPPAARDGKYHKLKVEIVGSNGRPLRVKNNKGKIRKIDVYAREGYTASKSSGEK